jgi:DNA replication protein DnaC
VTKADADQRFEDRVKLSPVPPLLMSEERGYLPLDRHGAHLFFQLIARRYARGAMLLTANPSFGQWAEGFGAPLVATASLDRLLHPSQVIKIQGEAYR